MLEKLAPDQAAYSYFWGEQAVFVFRLFQGKLSVDRISEDSRLPELLTDWVQYISRPPDAGGSMPEEMVQSGLRLGKRLLPGLSVAMKRLLILPDGMLGYLPFESVLTQAPNTLAFRDLAYLGNTHSVCYAYAGELWLQQSENNALQRPEYIGFAPVFPDSLSMTLQDSLTPLLYNREEVEQVAQLMGGTIYAGEDAKERQIKLLDGTFPNSALCYTCPCR